jgi:hypothetical protein
VAGSGDRAPSGLAYEINGGGEIYPQYLRIRSHSTRGVMQIRSRVQLSTKGTVDGLRAWFRSPRSVEVEGRRGDQTLIEIGVAAVQAPAHSNDAMTDLAALLKVADQAPYRAKRNPGRVTGRSVAATAH